MIKIILLFFMLCSSSSYASWNVVPDQTINISVKYDQESQQFYDLNASGSDLIDVSMVDGNAIKIKHGRDGYKGVVVPAYSDHRFARDSRQESRSHTLFGRLTKEVITLDVGRGNSKIMGMPTTTAERNFDGIRCRTTDTWTGSFKPYEVFNTKIVSVYSFDWCLGQTAQTSQYADFTFPNNGGAIGYIERYFKFSLDSINRMPLDEYVGTYSSHPTADVIRRGISDLGRELYRYVISINIKPSINSFIVDNENIDFLINKQSSQIIGKAQTGFKVRGSFHNSQAFNMTFSSLNNARCGGALCLSNTEANTQIPYQIRVLDPSTLQEKPVTSSGQKVTIFADKDFQLSGGLFFEFESDNTALSGTFNDVVTVRAELKII